MGVEKEGANAPAGFGHESSKTWRDAAITFQQVQKYENGTNRIGAGLLQQVAQILEVPVAFFFEETPTQTNATSADSLDRLEPSQGLLLLKAFMSIESDTMRRVIVELVNHISGNNSKP